MNPERISLRLRQLEYFIAVCEIGSITQAAAALHVAQPALGLQLFNLEQEFGTQLLNRTKRGVKPTPEGEIFLEEARFILARLRALKQRLGAGANPEVITISLGFPPSLASSLTRELASELLKFAPQTRIRLVEDSSHNLARRLEEGEIDFALAFEVETSRPLHRIATLREPLYFVTPRGSAFDVDGPIAFEKLYEMDLVMQSREGVVWKSLNHLMGQRRGRGAQVRIAYQVESTTVLKELILMNSAQSILPLATVRHEVDQGLLRARRVVDPEISRTLYIAYRMDRQLSEVETRLIEVLRQALARLRLEMPWFDDGAVPLEE